MEGFKILLMIYGATASELLGDMCLSKGILCGPTGCWYCKEVKKLAVLLSRDCPEVEQCGSAQNEYTISDILTQCTRPDQRFPNPNDCTSYFLCIGFGHIAVKQCPDGLYYDSQKLGCVLGTCTEQITTTTTTTTKETTTTTEVSTTEPSSPTCEKYGQRFPTYRDCYSYWQCLEVTKEPMLRTCPDNSYYNPTKQGCVIGKCSTYIDNVVDNKSIRGILNVLRNKYVK